MAISRSAVARSLAVRCSASASWAARLWDTCRAIAAHFFKRFRQDGIIFEHFLGDDIRFGRRSHLGHRR